MADNKQTKRAPVVRKSMSFPFQTSVACWIDLLGYGSMIANANFNPLHPNSKLALKRLRAFHEIVARHSARTFPTLVMNDGAVAYRDLSFRGSSVTYDFLARAWSLFQSIQTKDHGDGFPGPRLVLASGFRMRGRRAGMDRTNRQFQSVLKRFEDGKIGAEQAITEAGAIRQSFDIVPQLQANFAFTKAYVAETSGKAGRLGGSNFFVEMNLFDSPDPDWITFGPAISWSFPSLNLATTFSPVNSIGAPRYAQHGPKGIRDGLQVAQ